MSRKVANSAVIISAIGAALLAVQQNTTLFSAWDEASAVLGRAHNVKALTLSRILPDTLSISVAERVPIARIGRQGSPARSARLAPAAAA